MTTHFFSYTEEQQINWIKEAESALDLRDIILEKDIWICWVLKALFSFDIPMVFKGGTSLSKGFNLIHRFSEDLDICKNEEFNDFIKWVRFGDGGLVGDNTKFNQQKIIKFGHLVANMVSLHVMADMTHVANQLRKEGEVITNEILSHYSPYRTEHLTRLGFFPLDGNRQSFPLIYELLKNDNMKPPI